MIRSYTFLDACLLPEDRSNLAKAIHSGMQEP